MKNTIARETELKNVKEQRKSDLQKMKKLNDNIENLQKELTATIEKKNELNEKAKSDNKLTNRIIELEIKEKELEITILKLKEEKKQFEEHEKKLNQTQQELQSKLETLEKEEEIFWKQISVLQTEVMKDSQNAHLLVEKRQRAAEYAIKMAQDADKRVKEIGETLEKMKLKHSSKYDFEWTHLCIQLDHQLSETLILEVCIILLFFIIISITNILKRNSKKIFNKQFLLKYGMN